MLRPHDFPPGGAPRGDRCAPPNCVDGDPGDATPGENYEERDAPLTDVIVPARGDGPLEAQGSARGRLALPSLIRLPPRRLRWTPARGDCDGGRGAANFVGMGPTDFGGWAIQGGGHRGRGPGHVSDRPSRPDSVVPGLLGNSFDNNNGRASNASDGEADALETVMQAGHAHCLVPQEDRRPVGAQ